MQTLDYEHTKSYQLLVLATDQGVPPLSSQAVVNISVSDSNDNPPIFSQKTYSVQVSEDVHVGEIILKVRYSIFKLLQYFSTPSSIKVTSK